MYRLANESSVGFFGICAIMCYLFINQGGYFAGGIISTGLVIAILLFRIKLKIKPFDIIFLSFALWYLFCTVRTGFDVRYTAKGILPLLCLLFRWIIPENPDEGKKLCKIFIKVSLFIACISVMLCAYSSISSARLIRLEFPMQYSNVTGIFFGIMFILARYTDFEWSPKLQYVFLAGLVLTQSVGAVGLTIIAEVVLTKNKKKTFLFLVIMLIGAVLLRHRVIQSMGTFIERLVQSYDGFRCMLYNPIFGIGAGRWDLYKNIYQTGFYDAQVIHGSVAQIGAASGIPGLLLFILPFLYMIKHIKFENKAYLVGIIMLVCHSFIDFTFSYAITGFIGMILISCGEEKCSAAFEVNKYISLPAFVVIITAFVFLSTGMSQIKTLEKIDIESDSNAYIEYYETHPLAQKDAETTKTYAKALYASGEIERCLETLDKMPALSTNMVVLKKDCMDDWNVILDYLKIYPYNSPLYLSIFNNKNDDEVLINKTWEVMNNAVDSMSVPGKKLYYFKRGD